MLLFVGVISNGCNSSNGSNCASAGGVCVLASCSPYCLNGTCFTPLAESSQDCPNSITNSAGQTNTGNPCCLSQESADSGQPVSTPDAAGTPDAAQSSDATPGGDADATIAIDSSVPADASLEEGGSDSEASVPICTATPDGGDGGAGICSPDGGGD
jgi:hypothetical protein